MWHVQRPQRASESSDDAAESHLLIQTAAQSISLKETKRFVKVWCERLSNKDELQCREEKRSSFVMQTFNTPDWGGLTCWGVMSAIDWSAVGCLGVSPHWHSLILRWRELVISVYGHTYVPGTRRLSGRSLLRQPAFWEDIVTDLVARRPRLGCWL